MTPRLLLLTLACLCAAPALAQQVYSWTDANGTKHFSDTPPPPNTKEAKKLLVRNGVTREDTEAGTEDGASTEGPSMAAAAGYSQQDITRNCDAAQKNLAAYNASPPGEDATPEMQVEHQESISKAMSQIKLFCG
jgi:hypothetical protein